MIKTADLNAIRNLEDVLAFFADALDWPIEADDLDDATFDYTPDELGVDGSRVKDLVSLRQLRPLVPNQPWGIFFLEFAEDRLPVVQVRRLLQRLVERKRRSSQDQKTWALNDLLFVVITGTGDSVELHLVAFSDEGEGTPSIKTLEWRPGDTPKRRLTRLSSELLPRLEWPADDSATSDWQEQWQDAFRLRHGEAIRDAKRLAERMAAVAIEMRHEVETALTEEEGNGSLSSLLDAYRKQLSGTATPSTFADTAAQTLVYGLLTNRIADPEGFGASPTLAAVPLANPFLAEFFDRVLAHVEASAAAEDSLEQLVADLRATNVEAVLDEFGGTLHGGDPVIHLYEHFLDSYDRTQRADSGAFYTPTPIVRFIVQAIDYVLETRFDLSEGILSSATWGEVATRNNFAVPPGIDADAPFVSAIDPAVGTGTFLIEWVRAAKARYERSDGADSWALALVERVLPRLHGFELNPAAYAIAHVKLALECHEAGVELPEELLVLTSSLEHPAPQATLLPSQDIVARQGELGDFLKRNEAFTVAFGNPPYDREQRNGAGGGTRKGGVVRYGAPGQEPLLQPILDELKAAGDGVHAKNLYNDYVYFMRWATWRIFEMQSSPGIVSFITASSYLDGRSFGSLRSYLRRSFDELWIVDLGGDTRSAPQEENVFDIQTPVAIFVGVCSRPGQSEDCQVQYTKVGGSRALKLETLRSQTLTSLPFTRIDGSGFAPLTPPGAGDYFAYPTLDELCPAVWTGCKVGRTWPIAPFKKALVKRWQAIADAPRGERATLLKDTRDRTTTSRVRPMLTASSRRLTAVRDLRSNSPFEGIVQYAFRSFDRQWIIADHRLIDVRGANLWSTAGPGQVFFTTLASTRISSGPALIATPYVPDHDHFRGSYGGRNIVPLWRDKDCAEANVLPSLLEALSGEYALGVSGADFFAYIYGLLGTPAFTAHFADELLSGSGYVHIPITRSRELFEHAKELGHHLLAIHTWGLVTWGGDEYAPPSPRVIAPIRSAPRKYAFDSASNELLLDEGRIGPISTEAWAFEVSGLRVINSWLSQRLQAPGGKKSSPLDLVGPDEWDEAEELCRVIGAVQATIDATPRAAELISAVAGGQLLMRSDLRLG